MAGMTAMHIVSLTENLAFGGDEQRLLRFAQGVRVRPGFRHSVIALSRCPPGSSLEEDYHAAGIDVHFMDWPARSFDMQGRRAQPLSWSTVAMAKGMVRLVGLLRQLRPDVLDMRKHFAMALGVAAGRLARVPVLVGIDYHAGQLQSAQRRFLARRVFGKLDLFISDARATIDAYEHALPILAGRTRVIRNGIPAAQSQIAKADLLAHFGLKEPGRPLVAQVATIVPFKGQHVFLDAIERLVARGCDANFLICGFTRSQPYFEMLQQRIATNGLSNRVAIGGYPGPSADIWTVIDVHAHAASMDSAPIAILEGMSVARPLVTTSVGGIAEFVTDGETGLLVPPDDAAALAGGIDRLLSDRMLAARLGTAAQARFRARHSVEDMVDATLKAFAEVMPQTGPQALATLEAAR